MEQQPVLDVIGVTKRYGPSRGVQDVSFRVRRGEVVGLLGPNGAGKTTTLRVITGYLPASSGRVQIDGHDLWDEPFEVRRRVGYLPDNPPLYPEMTVWEYLSFMADIHEVPRARRAARIEEIAERLELTDVLGRLVGRLSRGYRQRVGLAQAVVHEPPLLVCDEPTVGLDPHQVVEMRELIRSFSKEHAVLFSSHVLSEVQLLCNNIVIIHGGRVQAQGSPAELTSHLHGGLARVRVRVKAAADEAAEALRGLDGVSGVGVEEEAAAAGGVARLLVEGGGGTTADDLTDRISVALAGRGWPVRELRVLENTLEELFLELTETEKAEKAQAARAAKAAAAGGKEGAG